MAGAAVAGIAHRGVRDGAGMLIGFIQETGVGVMPRAGQGAEQIGEDDQR